MYSPTAITPTATAANHGIIRPANGYNACGDEYLNQLMPVALMSISYSNAMRKATAVAHGANASESRKQAPSKDRFASLPIPAKLFVTAPAPKISTGINSGSTRRATSKPLPRNPRVNAAPMAPIILNVGVPSKSDNVNTPNESPLRPNCKPRRGDRRTTGKPEITQCEHTLPTTSTDRG